MGTGEARGLPFDRLATHPRGSRNTPSRFMLHKPEKSTGPDEPLGSYADFAFYFARSTPAAPMKLHEN